MVATPGIVKAVVAFLEPVEQLVNKIVPNNI